MGKMVLFCFALCATASVVGAAAHRRAHSGRRPGHGPAAAEATEHGALDVGREATLRSSPAESLPAIPRAGDPAGGDGAARDSDASLLRGGAEMRFASARAEVRDGEDPNDPAGDPNSTPGDSDPGASKVGPPVGYNKYSRPMEKTPMTVLVDLRIFNMYDLNDKEMTGHMDVLMELAWKDPRLAYDEAALQGRKTKRIDVNEIWSPGVSITNSQNVPRVVQSDASVAPDGTVRYVRRLDAFVVTPMDMHHFPFDEHAVHIYLDSFAYDASQIKLVPSEASKKFDPTGLANAIYDVSDWKVASRVQPSLLSPQDSVVDAQFTATRKPTGVFMEIIIPLSLISIFAMSAGYVALEHLDVRVGISSTAMLTVMAYLYVVSDKLPDIAYMCWIHFYTAMCFLFVFLVLIEVVAIHYLDPSAASHKQEEREQAFARLRESDQWAFYRASFATMMSMNSPASINTVVRNILPVLFAICNVILFAVEMPVPTFIATTIIILLAAALVLLYRYVHRKMQEAGELEVPETAEEAELYATRAKEYLASKKKKSLFDVAFVGNAEQQARDMREAEERGEEYVPRYLSGVGGRRLASKIVKYAKENPDWRKHVPEQEEKAEDSDRAGDGDDETRPLMHG